MNLLFFRRRWRAAKTEVRRVLSVDTWMPGRFLQFYLEGMGHRVRLFYLMMFLLEEEGYVVSEKGEDGLRRYRLTGVENL